MGQEQRTTIRRRIKHATSFEDRLANAARQARQAAELLPPGLDRDTLLQKASACETAAQINRWISSPGAGLPEELLLKFAEKAPPDGGV